MAEPVVRLTVNLTQEVADKLAELADRMGTNRTTALHKAILTTGVLAEKEQEGASVQVRDQNTVQDVHIISGNRSSNSA